MEATKNSFGDIVLDGSAKHTDLITPFDAHERATRNPKPDAKPQEFPKAIEHIQKEDAPEGHSEPIIARDAKHEVQLKKDLAAKKEDAE